jgi:hypothetical protein
MNIRAAANMTILRISHEHILPAFAHQKLENLNLFSQRFKSIQPDGLSGSRWLLLPQLSNRMPAPRSLEVI